MQVAMQRAGVVVSLHEVITLARAWSANGAGVPVASVLSCFAPQSEADHHPGRNSGDAGASTSVHCRNERTCPCYALVVERTVSEYTCQQRSVLLTAELGRTWLFADCVKTCAVLATV